MCKSIKKRFCRKIPLTFRLVKNRLDTSDLVLKTNYNADKTKLERRIPDVTDFVKKTKVTELKNKIPDVSSLGTKTALTAVENKIPDVSSLVNRTDYNAKVTEIEKKLTDYNYEKYITTSEFNTLDADVFNARLTQANLITKKDFDAEFLRINRKITENKSKNLLAENELNEV